MLVTEIGNSQPLRGTDGFDNNFVKRPHTQSIVPQRFSIFLQFLRFNSVHLIDFFQIKELNLDNCRATIIEGLTSDFKNLESLSLINVGLTTLKGLPSLPSLKKVMQYITYFR